MDTSKEFSLMLDSAIRQHPNIFKNFDRTKNVQDQLQEMCWDCLGTYCSNQMNSLLWGVWDFYNNIDDLDSMEQLWLAYVIKVEYNEQWTEKEWK